MFQSPVDVYSHEITLASGFRPQHQVYEYDVAAKHPDEFTRAWNILIAENIGIGGKTLKTKDADARLLAFFMAHKGKSFPVTDLEKLSPEKIAHPSAWARNCVNRLYSYGIISRTIDEDRRHFWTLCVDL